MEEQTAWTALTPDGKADAVTATAQKMMEIMRPWYDLAMEQDRQEKLRERYPSLKDAWDNYLFVLKMVDNGPEDDE